MRVPVQCITPFCLDALVSPPNLYTPWSRTIKVRASFAWKCSFLSIVNKHAPLRTMRVRTRNSPWITSELKKRMHDRDILKIKASKSNDWNDWSLFKKQSNIVNSEIRLAKQAYYQHSFNKYTGDSKKTWQTINELTSRKSGKKSVASLKVNGVSRTNPTELSNQFNIGPELASNIDSSNSDGYQKYLTGTVVGSIRQV